jgi:hypothetical protein
MTKTRNAQIAPAVVVAAALIGAGAAYAATKLHRTSSSPLFSSAAAPATFVASGTTGTARDADHGRGFGRGGGGDELTAAAGYLGLTESALATQLEAGKTLAQVAGATNGKTVAGLVDALVAAEKTEIAAAVTANRITQAQADQVIATLKDRFTALVNGTRPSHDGSPGFKQARGTHI